MRYLLISILLFSGCKTDNAWRRQGRIETYNALTRYKRGEKQKHPFMEGVIEGAMEWTKDQRKKCYRISDDSEVCE